jgi:hypothetical protein
MTDWMQLRTDARTAAAESRDPAVARLANVVEQLCMKGEELERAARDTQQDADRAKRDTQSDADRTKRDAQHDIDRSKRDAAAADRQSRR